MAKRWAKRLAAYSASAVVLLSGVSSYALKELEKVNAQEFENSKVIFMRREIPIQEFYENITYKKNRWVYRDKKTNKQYSVAQMSDFNIGNRTKAQKWVEAQKRRHTKIDTVYYMRVDNPQWQHKNKSNIVFQFGLRDSLPNMPSMGISGWEEMKIRQFEPKNCKREMSIEIYNDKYNCTSAHEEHHFYNQNPGEDKEKQVNVGQIGQSYELTFVETCLDEISANIEQLKAQRQKYLDNGNDLTHITPRFNFYAQAIKEGKINPERGKEISKVEKELIANGVFDSWMNEKYNIYRERNMKRTMRIHSSSYSNYNSVQENLPRHRRVVKHMFDKDGIDFSPYIFAREKEIIDRITPEQKAIFAAEVARRKENMTHLDKLEQLRIEKGMQAFNAKIEQNIKLAKVNRFVSDVKEFFGFNR